MQICIYTYGQLLNNVTAKPRKTIRKKGSEDEKTAHTSRRVFREKTKLIFDGICLTFV